MTGEREFRAKTAGGDICGWLREVPGKPNALLLHGGPGLNEYLDTLVAELDGLFTTARYQQRGLAPSVVSGDISIEGHIADAVAVLDALGWDKPTVIGHSWGGHFAMHLAAAHPESVGRLVIVDALGAVGDGGIEEFGPNLMRGLPQATQDRIADLDAQEENGEPLTEDERREHLSLLWPSYFGDPATAPPMPPMQFGRADETWLSIMAHFQSLTLEHMLPTVTVPTLSIHGGRSPIPFAEAEKVAALMPNARLVVHEGKGHWPSLEEPGFVRRQLEEFAAAL
ncbi:MAG: alpha/beta hydrolase [Chloroflexota bacterium]|nr:alpha/beta hydrolase [Chloroflexota bacterium]